MSSLPMSTRSRRPGREGAENRWRYRVETTTISVGSGRELCVEMAGAPHGKPILSPAHYGVEGFDYFAGMGELNAEDMKLFLSDPEEARRRHHEDWEEARTAPPERLAEVMKSVLSPVDAEAMTGKLAQWLACSARDGLAPGDQGWWDDGASHLTAWGFVPGAEAEVSDRDGHLTMLGRIGEVHDWLLQHL